MAPLRGALERRKRALEARLEWLRSLKTGDAVLLTCDGADRLRTRERVTVYRNEATGALYVDGHPRRDVRSGTWVRTGKAWLCLSLDPLGVRS